MSPHPVELGHVSSMAKPADGAPGHGEQLQRSLESWAGGAGGDLGMITGPRPS